MFNFLIVKEKGAVKIMDDSTRKIIGTGTINVTGRDGTVRTLKAIWYAPES